MPDENRVDYLEIPTTDVAASKSFFNRMFGWKFTDYGDDYCSFEDGRITGGFYQSDQSVSYADGSVLIVFFVHDLEAAEKKVQACGGSIVREIFSFPGGRRFHFSDPVGNEFAIWSDK
jgi:predicted enzyme related to lactoylglutathione lyase